MIDRWKCLTLSLCLDCALSVNRSCNWLIESSLHSRRSLRFYRRTREASLCGDHSPTIHHPYHWSRLKMSGSGEEYQSDFFEGTEKLLEVWFGHNPNYPDSQKKCDLRIIPRYVYSSLSFPVSLFHLFFSSLPLLPNSRGCCAVSNSCKHFPEAREKHQPINIRWLRLETVTRASGRCCCKKTILRAYLIHEGVILSFIVREPWPNRRFG